MLICFSMTPSFVRHTAFSDAFGDLFFFAADGDAPDGDHLDQYSKQKLM